MCTHKNYSSVYVTNVIKFVLQKTYNVYTLRRKGFLFLLLTVQCKKCIYNITYNNLLLLTDLYKTDYYVYYCGKVTHIT